MNAFNRFTAAFKEHNTKIVGPSSGLWKCRKRVLNQIRLQVEDLAARFMNWSEELASSTHFYCIFLFVLDSGGATSHCQLPLKQKAKQKICCPPAESRSTKLSDEPKNHFRRQEPPSVADRKTSRKLKIIEVLVLLTAVITHYYTLNN